MQYNRWLGVICFVTIIGVVIFWKFGPAPRAVNSHADESRPHWAHQTSPFNLQLNNYASASWARQLLSMTQTLAKGGEVNYSIVRPTNRFQCYPIVIPMTGMNLCTINENNEWLALAGYYQGPGSEHISGATVILNDYYLTRAGSDYATAEWRNKMLCQWLGWTIGAPLRTDSQTESRSCMNIYYDFQTVANQQYPDQADFSTLKDIYNHSDPVNNSDAGGSPTTDKNSSQKTETQQNLSVDQLGTKITASADGKVQTFRRQSTDGSSLYSVVIKP